MAGKGSELQTRLQEENNLAVHVHCNAHNLNLVLFAAFDGNDETRKFFSTLSGLYDFVMNARNHLYQLWKHCDESDCRKRTLNQLSGTRWSARYNAVRAEKDIFGQLLARMEWIEINDPTMQQQLWATAKSYNPKVLLFCLLCGKRS